MAAKITQEQIHQMIELYDELGTYSGVAKKMGISAATVSRYVKQQQTIHTYTSSREPSPIENISFSDVLTFSNLTPEELQSFDNWLKEF